MTSKSVEWFKQGARIDRRHRRDDATEKCVAIGVIACHAQAIPAA